MAIDVREVWSPLFLEAVSKISVYRQLCNANYERDAQNAGIVHIVGAGDVTIGEYDESTGLGDPEKVSDAERTLPLNYKPYFNVRIGSVEQALRNVDVMQMRALEAAKGMRTKVDTFISNVVEDADIATAGNVLAVAEILSSDDAVDFMFDLGAQMTNSGAPFGGRRVVVDAELNGLLSKSTRWNDLTNNTLVEGLTGRIAGFDVLVSNNVPNADGVFQILAAHESAITFADNLDEMEIYKHPKWFGDAMRGLYLCGKEVLYPEFVVVGQVGYTDDIIS